MVKGCCFNMEGTLVLILLVVLMLVGSYVAGSIPLAMPMSEVKLQDHAFSYSYMI